MAFKGRFEDASGKDELIFPEFGILLRHERVACERIGLFNERHRTILEKAAGKFSYNDFRITFLNIGLAFYQTAYYFEVYFKFCAFFFIVTSESDGSLPFALETILGMEGY